MIGATAAMTVAALSFGLSAAGPVFAADAVPARSAAESTFDINEASIADLTEAMENGTITSVELTARYLNRIAKFDSSGIRLNAVPVLNPQALADAAESDRLRAEGTILGPLHGIPFTVKDSYKVAGLTVAAGSPAFENLVADEDAYNVGALRAAGAIVVGKTNMPPLANSGMPRGVYGRAESPYNVDYLSAAWNSGSSNGSGVSTAANFAAFGMGEETVSSGRSPASNNGLVAYTPSRGIISIRGNWPLGPTMDVVVPHTRSVEDLMTVLDVVAHEDPSPVGDFWLEQPYIEIPSVEEVRPESYHDLKEENSLEGVRIGVPRMYVNEDTVGTQPTVTRESIIELWERTAEELRALGAEVVPVDFPLVENANEDRPGAQNMYTRGMAPTAWRSIPWGPLQAYYLEDFLQSNDDPNYPSWTAIDPRWVFPAPTVLRPSPDEFQPGSYQRVVDNINARTVESPFDLEGLEGGLRGEEEFRELLFDDWMDESGLDMLAFPANADVGEANADVNIEANQRATALGVARSNTAGVMRTYGLPSVSVPMGLAEDIQMPVDVTFVGKPYTDNDLISYAYAYEQATTHRVQPPRAPSLPRDVFDVVSDPGLRPDVREDSQAPTLTIDAQSVDFGQPVPRIEAVVSAQDASGIDHLELTVNGDEITLVARPDGTYRATVFLDRYLYPGTTGPVDTVRLMLLARDGAGNASAQFTPVSLDGAVGGPGPAPEPSPEPTGEPSPEPTGNPSPEPTGEPSPEPTGDPSPEPTGEPSPEPTGEPSPDPTVTAGPGTDDELTDATRGGLTLSATQVTPGARVTGRLPNAADAAVAVWLHSTPVQVAAVTTAPDGAFAFVVPGNTEVGEHRVVVRDAQGAVLGWAALDVVAAAAGSLAATGGTIAGAAVVVAIMTALLGTMLVIGRRRRKAATLST